MKEAITLLIRMGESGRNTVVLLGAGASVDAGLPTTEGLTRCMLDFFASSDGPYRQFDNALRFIHHTTEADRASRGLGGTVDIERLFLVVDQLAERDTTALNPFVERWHGSLERFDSPEPPDYALEREAVRVVRGILSPPRGRPAESQVARDLVALVRRRGRGDVSGGQHLRGLRDAMLRTVPSLLKVPEHADLAYLKPLFGVPARGTLTIATLNYDVTVERCAELHAVSLSTGMAGWCESGAFAWGDSSVRLLKLHGSCDWWAPKSQRSERWSLGVPALEAVPGIIFGEGNKLRARGPFLTLFMEFTESLRSATDVLVVGYSFRDEHVNAALLRWANERSGRRLIVVSPTVSQKGTMGSAQTEPVLSFLRQLDLETNGLFRFQAITTTARDGITKGVEAAGS
ncbi:MAG: SIR2 family protein [Ilumatobacteraceae bacterium]